MRHYSSNLWTDIYGKNEYFTILKIWYSVTIHIDSIWNRPNSLWQTEHWSYLIFMMKSFTALLYCLCVWNTWNSGINLANVNESWRSVINCGEQYSNFNSIHTCFCMSVYLNVSKALGECIRKRKRGREEVITLQEVKNRGNNIWLWNG